MSFYIVANKSTHEIIEHAGTGSKLETDTKKLTKLLNNIGVNYSIPVSNLAVFLYSEKSIIAKRIKKNDQYTIVWKDDKIQAISFDAEDVKRYLNFSAEHTIQHLNEKNIITVQVLKSNSKDVDNAVKDTMLIPLLYLNYGIIMAKFKFSKGVAKKIIAPSTPGKIVFGGIKANNYRNDNILQIDVVL